MPVKVLFYFQNNLLFFFDSKNNKKVSRVLVLRLGFYTPKTTQIIQQQFYENL